MVRNAKFLFHFSDVLLSFRTITRSDELVFTLQRNSDLYHMCTKSNTVNINQIDTFVSFSDFKASTYCQNLTENYY